MIKNSQRALLKAAAIVAYEHHEKYDGTGYPRGLQGDEIHIYGRITAVADVYDALGSDRVYKKAWEDERIYKLFKEERGKHFDPRLVDLFFENLDQFLTVREEFNDIYLGDEHQEEKTKEKIQILGAYGTRSKGHGTSSIALNPFNVIDAGNILEGLEVNSIDIENIWLTHAHLDHIVDIAYILDNYFGLRKKTLNIHGLPKTIQSLKECFLNDRIWPDFSKINLINSSLKAVQYTEIVCEKEYVIGKEETLEAFYSDHVVDSCGYIYKKENHAVLISSDTYSLTSIIKILETRKEIKTLVVECSFPSNMEILAKESKHLTPKLLFQELKMLQRDDIYIYINHIKPSYEKKIKDEIAYFRGKWKVEILKDKEFIYFS
jgi:ribonuclease BN (tRNA processing enzyme)